MNEFTGWATEIFGSWPNVTQGAAGTALGVLGAYGVAVYTLHKERKRDRELSREAAGVSAAGELLSAVVDLPSEIERIGNLEWTSGSGVDYENFARWVERRERIKALVIEHGSLLPEHIETTATQMVQSLGGVMYGDFDEELKTIILIEPGEQTARDDATAKANAVVEQLRSYRRDPQAGAVSARGKLFRTS